MTTTNPKQHVHHDMIVAWAKNPNKRIQFKHAISDKWMDLPSNIPPAWEPILEYRFKPEIITVTYRKALMKKWNRIGYDIVNMYGAGMYKENISHTFFVKWLGDPITETIEI